MENIKECLNCKKIRCILTRGLCGNCYSKMRKNGTIEQYKKVKIKSENKCRVKGCTDLFHAKGYCQKHYNQFIQFGQIPNRTRFTPNEIIINSELNYAEMVLYNKDCEEIARTIIDVEDIDKCKKYKWKLLKNNYVCSRISFKEDNKNKSKSLLLHRYLMNPSKNMVVDHINRNRLDNRKQNLRICTLSENNRNHNKCNTNTSGVTGVAWISNMNKWLAYIHFEGTRINLGYFIHKEDAIKTRLEAEKKYNYLGDNLELYKQYGVE